MLNANVSGMPLLGNNLNIDINLMLIMMIELAALLTAIPAKKFVYTT
jgi:hypothetical protein